jgi:hypothetical protein
MSPSASRLSSGRFLAVRLPPSRSWLSAWVGLIIARPKLGESVTSLCNNFCSSTVEVPTLSNPKHWCPCQWRTRRGVLIAPYNSSPPIELSGHCCNVWRTDNL